MKYLIESWRFDPLYDGGDYTGEFIPLPDVFKDSWEEALAYFVEQVKNPICDQCFVTALWNNKPYENGEPVLSYCP